MRILLVACLLVAPAYAQPASGGKVDAKSLMQSGVRLFEAKDYLGALAVFRDAYARFPSAKILLNIGTTLKALDRKAEAANTYQRYLESSDADPNKKAEVTAQLAELDKGVGVLEVTVTPSDAEVQFTDEWIPAATAKLWRVTPGTFKVQARREGYSPDTKVATINAGEKAALFFKLVELPKAQARVVEVPRNEVHAQVEQEGPRAPFGAFVMFHVSVLPKLGSAALIGATADVTHALAIDAAVLLGPGLVSSGMSTLPPPSFGGYLGASYAFLPGALRPRASAGMTIFASDGARFQVRAAGGVEYNANRHIAMLLEVGAELVLNPEDDIRRIDLVPAIAVIGRL
jgi:hypothetical protein